MSNEFVSTKRTRCKYAPARDPSHWKHLNDSSADGDRRSLKRQIVIIL